jgi:hypothetical protein
VSTSGRAFAAAAGRSLELGDQPVGATGVGISPSQMLGPAACRSPVTLASTGWSIVRNRLRSFRMFPKGPA